MLASMGKGRRREDPILAMGIGYQLRATFMAIHRRLKAAVSRHGITPDQYVVLWVLNAYGALTQREIHQRIYSDGNTIGQVLRRMERRGWITRRPDERDGRAIRVGITREGERMRRRIFAIARAFHRRALTGFGPRDRAAIVDYLVRIRRSLERAGPGRSV